jgi:hypothetical protein
MEKEINYEKLRIDILKLLVESRNIDCKLKRDEMIKYLKLDDEEKYIRPVIYTKLKDGAFMVGIDIRDQESTNLMVKLIEKGIAKHSNLYCDDRIHYISKEKLI